MLMLAGYLLEETSPAAHSSLARILAQMYLENIPWHGMGKVQKLLAWAA